MTLNTCFDNNIIVIYRINQFCRKVGLSRGTVINLEKRGIITPLRLPSGERRYTEEHVKQVLNYYQKHKKLPIDEKACAIYCRVSTKDQKEHLKIKYLQLKNLLCKMVL